MVHHLLMALAGLTRWAMKWSVRFAMVLFLLTLNVAVLVSDSVYDAMSRMVWDTIEMVSDRFTEHRPKTRAEMDAEIKRAADEATLSKAESDAAAAETARVRSDLEKAKAETVHARGELDDARARNRALMDGIDVRDRKIAKLTTEVDILADEMEISRKTRQEAMDAAEGLRKRLVRSIRRDASTEIAEAVPFIGTAVFLGSIAYDLNDTCQQLRELETLDAALHGRKPLPINETMCLMSYEDMVAALTGKDRAYARCVSDRIAMNDLNPPSCEGYDPALPSIEDDVVVNPQDETHLLPEIR